MPNEPTWLHIWHLWRNLVQTISETPEIKDHGWLPNSKSFGWMLLFQKKLDIWKHECYIYVDLVLVSLFVTQFYLKARFSFPCGSLRRKAENVFLRRLGFREGFIMFLNENSVKIADKMIFTELFPLKTIYYLKNS